MPTKIPVNWEEKTLGDLCTIRPPKSEVKDNLKLEDLVSFAPMEYLGIKSKYFSAPLLKPLKEVVNNYTYFADNDVLLAKITPCFENGKLGIATNLSNGVGFGSSEYLVFRTKPELNNQFLYYFLLREQFRIEGAKQMRGAVGHKRVPPDFIENYLIKFPKDIEEQQKIVAVLDEAFEEIEQAKQNAQINLQNAKDLFESYLHEIFTTNNASWKNLKIEDISEVKSGFNFSSKDFSSNNFVKSIKITNVGVGEFIDSSDSYLPENFKLTYKKYLVNKGEIVIALTRTIISSGLKVATVPSHYDQSLLNQRVASIKVNENIIDKNYIYLFLQTNYVINYVKSQINELMQPNLSITDLKKLQVPLPSLELQKEIVYKLNTLQEQTEQLEQIYQQKIELAEELKQSILQKAFSGELIKHECLT